MNAKVVQLKRLARSDWSPRELGEFYRVEAVLIQAGLSIETDAGVSDEGDPWFAFCRRDNWEVLVHIARIRGVYILAGASYGGVASGTDICSLVRNLTDRHPLVQMQGREQGCCIFMHPVALLVTVVAAAFFKSTDARALIAENQRTSDARGGAVPIRSEVSVEVQKTVILDAAHGAAVLSAVEFIFSSSFAVGEARTSPDFGALDSSAHSRAVSDIKLPAIPPDAVLNQHIDRNYIAVESPYEHIIGDAIPLFALLSDLAMPLFPAVTVGEVSKVFLPTSLNFSAEVLILSVTMSLNRESGVLPVVQSVKVTGLAPQKEFSTNQNDSQVEIVQKLAESHDNTSHSDSYTAPQLNHLSSALITALKIASHTTIDLQQSGGATPFATTLINLLSNKSHDTINAPTETVHSSGGNEPTSHIATANATDKASAASNSAASTSGSISGTSLTASSVTAAAPDKGVSTVEKIVQDFTAHTTWQYTTEGNQVVIFDQSALAHYSPNELATVTFDFSDGSTLSLVGLAATVHHATMV